MTRVVAAFVAAMSVAACRNARGSNASSAQTGAAAAGGPASEAQALDVESCAPCIVKIGRNLPDYAVTFTVRETPDGRRTVDALQVSRTDRAGSAQSLPVHTMTPVAKGDDFFLGAGDINFDGYDDLYFATSRGVANAYADYWLLDPARGTFSYLGNYPIFKVDAQTRELSTYERGGDGGMIYTSKHYAFINGTLTVIASEEQEKTAQDGVYRKSVFQLRDGQLALVKREEVRPPK